MSFVYTTKKAYRISKMTPKFIVFERDGVTKRLDRKRLIEVGSVTKGGETYYLDPTEIPRVLPLVPEKPKFRFVKLPVTAEQARAYRKIK